MKPLRLLAIALLLALSNLIHAQWVSIPDTNFATYLNNNGISACLQGNNTIGWQMDTTCNAVITTTSIFCPNKDITNLTGVQYFDQLKHLTCDGNELTALPPLPPVLKELNCSGQGTATNNKINALPLLPASLAYLSCAGNNITVLPALPVGLISLTCGENPIDSLPAILPDSLKNLSCRTCSLDTIPALPAGLKLLDFVDNNVSTLPVLPDSLVYLYFAFNPVTALPMQLPPLLEILDCSISLIDTIPALPATLKDLSASATRIKHLPVLPAGLEVLSIGSDTIIGGLSFIPPKVHYLDIFACDLTTLPALPDSLAFLDISANPISCLPPLKIVHNFRFWGTNITCLPNYPVSNFYSDPEIDTIPLCDVFNPNSCDVLWNISGQAYLDNTPNCLLDTLEKMMGHAKLQLWENGTLQQQVLATPQGNYSFDTHAFSTYQTTIDTSNIPFRILCPSSGSLTSVISAADSMDYNMDFALTCKPGFDLEARSISTTQVFRPANFTTVEVGAGDASNFYNAHCAAGTAGLVILSYTGPAKYISPANGALTPTSVSGNTLTWSVADFGTVNFFTDFDIIMQTDTFAQAGQQVCFDLTASPIIGDNNPANNTLTHCFTVVNSFDPNDKTAYPSGNIDTLQEDLVYTVRFQNTGNAEAQHIYITDTLDANVRPETFELLAYSHAPMVQLDGNNLRFNFPNINLPDSFTNEPASHGYVQYRVKLKENLPIGTTINNTAFIYFDFNAPVVTNTTTNTVAIEVDTTVGIQAVKSTAEVFVYPNPASNMVTVTLGENVPNSIITITDIVGRTVLQPVTLTNTRSVTLSTRQLPGGVYLVNVKSPQGMQVTKRLLVSK